MDSSSKSSAPEQEYQVTPLELFFDLVFVLAVSQLSHHLSDHLSWRGAAETLVLLLAVFAVWFYTSWAATMIPAERSRTQWMVLVVMLLGLFMNASVTAAFDNSGWAFVIPFVLIQLGRTFWTVVNSPNAQFRNHFVRTLIWLTATAPLWIAGATASPQARLLWWAAAAGVDLVSTWLAHPLPGRRLHSEHLGFDAEHMLERCRLFLIIALGETVLATGAALSAAPMSMMTLVTGTTAFAGTVALWALFFGRSHRLTLRHLKETRDPVRTSRLAINSLTAMVAGLIAVAVANEKVIAHPQEQPSVALSLLLFGGAFVSLLAQAWYLRAVLNLQPRLHLAGSAVLVLVGFASLAAAPYVALGLAAGILAVLALLDRR